MTYEKANESFRELVSQGKYDLRRCYASENLSLDKSERLTVDGVQNFQMSNSQLNNKWTRLCAAYDLENDTISIYGNGLPYTFTKKTGLVVKPFFLY